jgi:hypothetical protein
MLSAANKRHDIIAITITDPRELDLPDIGIIQLDDPETGKSFLADSSNPNTRREYSQNAHKKIKERETLFRASGVDTIALRTDSAYSKSLFKFFKVRQRRKR